MHKYNFENYHAVNKENYKEMPEIFQKEMKQIAQFDAEFYGGTIERFMEACVAEFPDTPDWDLYDVVLTDAPEKIVYHFWKYFDEYGSLFHADTGEDTGMGMMNFNFELHDGSAKQMQICKNLQQSFYEEE